MRREWITYKWFLQFQHINLPVTINLFQSTHASNTNSRLVPSWRETHFNNNIQLALKCDSSFHYEVPSKKRSCNNPTPSFRCMFTSSERGQHYYLHLPTLRWHMNSLGVSRYFPFQLLHFCQLFLFSFSSFFLAACVHLYKRKANASH